LVLPDFWTGVIRGACLGIGQSFLEHFGNVEISQFVGALLADEYVCGFQISVKDFLIMERLESMRDIQEGLPDLCFTDACLALEMLIDEFREVASLCKLHYDAKVAGLIIVEGLFELDDELVVQGSEDADFVQRIFFLLFLHS
jgi:hypothetical protein